MVDEEVGLGLGLCIWKNMGFGFIDRNCLSVCQSACMYLCLFMVFLSVCTFALSDGLGRITSKI